MYFVYVIRNLAGRIYIGVSENVSVRLNQHNLGVSRWTRGKGPWNLVWKSEAMSLESARRFEIKLKRQKGGNGFYQMTGIKPDASGS